MKENISRTAIANIRFFYCLFLSSLFLNGSLLASALYFLYTCMLTSTHTNIHSVSHTLTSLRCSLGILRLNPAWKVRVTAILFVQEVVSSLRCLNFLVYPEMSAHAVINEGYIWHCRFLCMGFLLFDDSRERGVVASVVSWVEISCWTWLLCADGKVKSVMQVMLSVCGIDRPLPGALCDGFRFFLTGLQWHPAEELAVNNDDWRPSAGTPCRFEKLPCGHLFHK